MDKQKLFDVHPASACSPHTKQDPSFHILVPIVSTTADEQVFTHAAQVAATQNGLIHLFHITDFMQLPAFENPFAVRRWLREVRAEATSRLKSLAIMIEKLGAKVFSMESSVGNSSYVLHQKVQSLIPDLIIVGQDSLRNSTFEKLTRKSPCPVVIVPGTINRSVLYVGVYKKRTKIDSLDLLYGYSTEKWSLN